MFQHREDSAEYGKQSIGRIEAPLPASQMGLEDTPDAYTNLTFLVMSPHCHAPSCIREELWNADTGELLCNVSAMYGSEEHGVLGAVFNEANYVAIPPCIFGDQPGLQEPISLRADTNITAIKYFNNTFRHLGQMAQWQVVRACAAAGAALVLRDRAPFGGLNVLCLAK